MPTIYRLCSTLVLLFWTVTVTAQNYRPFGPDRTYHYRETTQWSGIPDQINLFRVDSVAAGGADSVFYFNDNIPGRNGPPSASSATLFGKHFRWNSQTGEAIFRGFDNSSTTTDSVRLLTRAAVGQSWAFTSRVQATLTSRQVELVAGRPDSVLIISLSDTQQVKISQHYGIISGPGLHYYLKSDCFSIYRYNSSSATSWNKKRHQVRLSSIPELNLGPFDLRLSQLYNVQPGDVFFYRNSFEGGFYSCFEAKTRRQVIRVIQRAGVARTVYFHSTQIRTSSNVLGGCTWPPSGGNITQYQTNDSMRLSWTQELLTGYNGALYNQVFYPGTYDSLAVGGRPQVRYCLVSSGPGSSYYYRFAPGLGLTEYTDSNGSSCCHHAQTDRMVGFIKGTEVWGDTTMPRLLALPDDVRRLPATLAPNPSDAAATPLLTFSTDQPQAATLALYDALGRQVWHQTQQLATGGQRLPVSTHHLPAGLYRLRVTLADGQQRVLPLVRE